MLKDKKLANKIIKLDKESNLIKAEKERTILDKDPRIKAYQLCKYNSCKNLFYKFMKESYDSFHNRVKLYDVKLSPHLKKLSDEHTNLYKKKTLTEEEIIRFFIINKLLLKETINILIKSSLFKLNNDYVKCTIEKCSELSKIILEDSKLMTLKMNMMFQKDINVSSIKETLSHPKQVALDKCITKHCNKISFNLMKEMLKLNIKKIELNKLKVPEDIQMDINYLSSLKQLTEKDIPKSTISLLKITKYIDSKIKLY